MSKKQRLRAFLVFGVILILLLCGIFLVGKPNGAEEPIGEVMKNEVLHETNRVRLGPLSVNPGLISAFTLTGIFLVFCVIVRLFVIPRFKKIPGRFSFFWRKRSACSTAFRKIAALIGTISSAHTYLPRERISSSERSLSCSAFRS